MTPASLGRESVRLGREILARGAPPTPTTGSVAGPEADLAAAVAYMEHSGGHEIPGKALEGVAGFVREVLAAATAAPPVATSAGGGEGECAS